MKRTLSRIKVLFKLYQYDLLNGNIDDNFNDDFNKLLDEAELDDKAIDEDFASYLYEGIINNLPKIDKTIAINLTNYTLDRLSYVDRNLIRIGTFELMFNKTPKEVIINEIVNLSKEYSQTEDFLSSKFNNALLDKIAKGLNN